MKKKRLLITGVSGLLGSNLAFCLKDHYEILGFSHAVNIKIDGVESRSVDLRYKSHPQNYIKYFDPDVLIHCAAQANVDVCQEHQELAWDVNVKSTANLLSSLEGMRTKFIFISTDLVYDGVKGDFKESDPLGPRNYYAQTKVAAEELVLARAGSLVLRTNFFGWNITAKRSLAEWVIEQLQSGKQISGFTDAIFSSIYTFDLARTIDGMITRDLQGVYNCVSRTALSKHEFLVRVAKKAGLGTALIRPGSIDDGGLKAARSKNLSLDVSKLTADLGRDMPSIEECIDHFVADIPHDYGKRISTRPVSGPFYPHLSVLPYGRQCVDDEDIGAVVDVLKSSNLTQGPKIEEFECALVASTGALFAAVVNSATSALHIACRAVGVTAGDEVITSTNTFAASANCAVYCGAVPVFVDIDHATYNMSVEALADAITVRTKAVIVVHFAGQSCPMGSIKEAVDKAQKKFGHKIFIIEDASHALGSRYDGLPVGACALSDMAILSFHPVKHITTGEGGAILTKDPQLHRACLYLRSHGITSHVDEFIQHDQAFTVIPDIKENETLRNPWYYEQRWLGFNYRITDIQCALGISQLKKLDRFIARRRAIVGLYNQSLIGLKGIVLPKETNASEANFHLYVLRIDFDMYKRSRAQIMLALRKQGIVTQVHYIPVHTHPFYQEKYGTRWGDFPVAEAYYRQCLSLPLHPAMRDEDVADVVRVLKSALGS